MYYNQNNYANVPYPAPGYENATVKSGGCGVCCASMVAEGLTGRAFPPGQSAAFALRAGARVPGGTDMKRLSAALATEFGLTAKTASDSAALADHLAAGGWAIANVGGNRAGYTGLFSDGGHYVVVRGQENQSLIVWDPGYYSGKLDRPGRKGRATLRGNDILVSPGQLEADCQSRSPRYYLFSAPPGHTPSPWAAQAWEKAAATGILDGTYPQSPLTREQLALVLHRLGLLGRGH